MNADERARLRVEAEAAVRDHYQTCVWRHVLSLLDALDAAEAAGDATQLRIERDAARAALAQTEGRLKVAQASIIATERSQREAEARIAELESKLAAADEAVSRFNKDAEMQALMAINNALRARLEAAKEAGTYLAEGYKALWLNKHPVRDLAEREAAWEAVFARSALADIEGRG